MKRQGICKDCGRYEFLNDTNLCLECEYRRRDDYGQDDSNSADTDNDTDPAVDRYRDKERQTRERADGIQDFSKEELSVHSAVEVEDE